MNDEQVDRIVSALNLILYALCGLGGILIGGMF